MPTPCHDESSPYRFVCWFEGDDRLTTPPSIADKVQNDDGAVKYGRDYAEAVGRKIDVLKDGVLLATFGPPSDAKARS